jgi:hypothetical protein
VANAVALQTVVDHTQALHALSPEGVRIGLADLVFLSSIRLGSLSDLVTTLPP